MNKLELVLLIATALQDTEFNRDFSVTLGKEGTIFLRQKENCGEIYEYKIEISGGYIVNNLVKKVRAK